MVPKILYISAENNTERATEIRLKNGKTNTERDVEILLSPGKDNTEIVPKILYISTENNQEEALQFFNFCQKQRRKGLRDSFNIRLKQHRKNP